MNTGYPSALQNSMRLLFVHKPGAHDPSLQAILRWLPRVSPGVQFFVFSDEERGKQSPETHKPNQRLVSAIQTFAPTHILSWVPLMNESEIELCHRMGICISAATNSFVSLSSGIFRNQGRFLRLLSSHHAYFVTHEPHLDVLRKYKINALPMPFFYDPDIYHPRTSLFQRFDPRKYPVLFIGSVMERGAENRVELLRAIAKHFPVYVLTYQKPNIPGVHWLGVTNRENRINRLLNRSLVVLGSDRIPYQQIEEFNARIEQPVELYDMDFALRCRVATTLGSGACYSVERHPEMQSYIDKNNVLLWDDTREAVDQIESVLHNSDYRLQLATRGWTQTQSRHTVEIRLRQMINALLQTKLRQ
jgi:hypothetical protein